VLVGVRFVGKDATPQQMTIGLQLIERGLQEFPRDCLMLFIAGNYMDAFYGDSGAKTAIRIFDELKKRKPPFDIKFQMYSRERADLDQRKTSGVADGEEMHVLESAEFQNLDRKVKREHFLALSAVRDFWEGIRTQAETSKLSDAVARLGKHCHAAKESYATLLVKYPKNKNILRSYAQFLLTVEGDSDRANVILDLVEEGT
jgi:predicted Zn-dependent protease